MAFRRGLVSISVFEASHLEPVSREQQEPLRPDGLYPVPYPLNYGTSTDSKGNVEQYLLTNFASSVARALSVRLEDHGFNSGWATTTVRLSPSLADEEVRHLTRQVYRTGCIANEIAVGVSRNRWTGGTLLDRRALLVSAIMRSVKLAAQREGWRSDIPEVVKREFDAEQQELSAFKDDSRSQIQVPRRVFALLRMRVWNGMTAQQRQEVAAAVTEALAAQGRKTRYVGISCFGPDFDQQRVAQWHDDETGFHFSLIPGGEFRPGCDARLLSNYKKVYERLYSMTIREAQDAGEAESVRCRPDSMYPFGSMGPCDIRAKAPVSVSPLLMACDPVTHSLDAGGSLVDSRRIRAYGDSGNAWHPLYLAWGEAGLILRRYGWTVPTSVEMEWAIGAGRANLFYWGDEPHKAILAYHSEEEIPEEEGEEAFDTLLHGSFEPDHPRVWPWTNRFGLAAVLAHNTWCRPDQNPDSLYPLIHRGGA
ncbi:MAG: hypothetical protein ABSH20_08940, partial [Tepidisphaeraceae bacterium]